MCRSGSLWRVYFNVLRQRLVGEPRVLCVRASGASHCETAQPEQLVADACRSLRAAKRFARHAQKR
jgi:hypothetical protein